MRSEVLGEDYRTSQVSAVKISAQSLQLYFCLFFVFFRTEGHQRLKRFLHPNCDVCNQEFPARMEWVEHRFSPEHLRKLKEVNDSKVGDERKFLKNTTKSIGFIHFLFFLFLMDLVFLSAVFIFIHLFMCLLFLFLALLP